MDTRARKTTAARLMQNWMVVLDCVIVVEVVRSGWIWNGSVLTDRTWVWNGKERRVKDYSWVLKALVYWDEKDWWIRGVGGTIDFSLGTSGLKCLLVT